MANRTGCWRGCVISVVGSLLGWGLIFALAFAVGRLAGAW